MMTTCCLSDVRMVSSAPTMYATPMPESQVRRKRIELGTEGEPEHELVIGQPGEKQSDENDHPTALQDLRDDRAVVRPPTAARGEREVRRNADDEQEVREDQVGGRPPVPVGVLQRRIDRAPGAGVVDEQHSGDGETAKDIEREQPL